MARKKAEEVTTERNTLDSSGFEAASVDVTEKLGEAFEKVITSQYGYARAPQPYLTEFGIKHLDALLGGGIVSSAPVVLSSTPETGKSTLAFQFSSVFQKIYPNSMIVYLDIEAAANTAARSKGMSRIEIMGIDTKRFRYEPIIIDVFGFFDIIQTLCDIKRKFEEASKKEFKVLIIWDSLAGTTCSKIASADSPNSIIGLKARQVSFCIDKYSPLLAYNRITFLTIDQVRANIKIDTTMFVPKEQTVGTWNDYKAASNIAAFEHRVSQWLFLSKKESITPVDGMGINGWYLTLFSEKNKQAPSRESITCVFDKREGLHKFWSEFTFLEEMTRSEKRYFKDEKNLCYPLSIQKASDKKVCLVHIDPASGASQYKSEPFYRRSALDLYKSDENFKNAFDAIMDIAVDQRIKQGIFRSNVAQEVKCDDMEVVSDTSDTTISVNPEEGSIVHTIAEEGVKSPSGTYESVF